MLRPQAFASGADAWSMPISVSGPIQVAADIRFDQRDMNRLQYSLRPAYSLGTAAGGGQPHLLLSAYYSPADAQNLVADLEGWVTPAGRFELSSRSLPRDRITLGPAQASRLVFLNPHVQDLLGVRNKELRDVGKSSLSSIWLGKPHIVFFAGGIIQIQTVYNVSSGRGVAQRLGVTVFLDGRAGIGKTLTVALRQALNPPAAVTRDHSPAPGRKATRRGHARSVQRTGRRGQADRSTETHRRPHAADTDGSDDTDGGPATPSPAGGSAGRPQTSAGEQGGRSQSAPRPQAGPKPRNSPAGAQGARRRGCRVPGRPSRRRAGRPARAAAPSATRSRTPARRRQRVLCRGEHERRAPSARQSPSARPSQSVNLLSTLFQSILTSPKAPLTLRIAVLVRPW